MPGGSQSCLPGCECGRHANNKSWPCLPGCGCGRHVSRPRPCPPGCRCGKHIAHLCLPGCDCHKHRPQTWPWAPVPGRTPPPAVTWPCVMVLSVDKAGRFLVRCECMAQTRNPPAYKFRAWDWIARTKNAAEAPAIWRAHRDEVLRKQGKQEA